jgi:hypothetical protein
MHSSLCVNINLHNPEFRIYNQFACKCKKNTTFTIHIPPEKRISELNEEEKTN